MLKILIADDELYISQLIYKMVDWEARDITVVGMVSNGKEALEAIEQHKPDIVITDIRMPGMDGLELVKYTKEKNWDISYIIISGYKYFEYAHTALNLGVEHYLLKPIDKMELESILNQICASIHEKKHLSNSKEWKSKAEKGEKMMRKHFLNSIIYDHVQTIPLEKEKENYCIEFQNSWFQAFYIKIDCEDEGYWKYESILNIIAADYGAGVHGRERGIYQ